MVQINPAMLPRLDELETDLQARSSHAGQKGWLGEIEGLQLTLSFLRDKRTHTQRLVGRGIPVSLGMPSASPAPRTPSRTRRDDRPPPALTVGDRRRRSISPPVVATVAANDGPADHHLPRPSGRWAWVGG
jgi:hypothetical protein